MEGYRSRHTGAEIDEAVDAFLEGGVNAPPSGAYITEESDPTVPSWAKQPEKPAYNASEVGARPDNWMPTPEEIGARPSTWTPTADEVGADQSGTAESKVAGHNTAADSHNDIRLLIQGLDARLAALANSDDETLDQMGELVAYIKSNRGLIESVTTSKVNVTDIIDNLATNVANKPLSAAQGVALKALIDGLERGKAAGDHKHDGVYQPVGSYAAANHGHDGVYQPKGNYAAASHGHDGVYQQKGSYAAANHGHDSTYIKRDELDTVPDYVKEEARAAADKVVAVRDAYSFVFGAVSDLHYNGESAASILHAGMGMYEIHKRTRLDAVLNFGDIMYGSLDSSNIEGFPYVRGCLSDVMKAVPYIQMQGNHDEYDTAYTEAEEKQKYFAHIGANNAGAVTDWPNRHRNYGYRDFEDERMRVIYLNSVDLSTVEVADLNPDLYGTDNKCYISGVQLKWLAEKALDFSTKDDDENWSFIVCSHHPLNWSGVQMGKLLSVLKAYRGKSSGSVAEDGVTVSFNFTNAKAMLVAHFHGHLHNFRAETLDGVPTITIPNACFGRNNEYGQNASQKQKWGDADANGVQRFYNKTAGTAEDTAFDVIVIDRTHEVVRCINYGAGLDRAIPYGMAPKVYYGITNTLSNVTTSNSASSAEEGASYSATLTAKDGYTMEGGTVKVTMGGVNISTSAYGNGKVSIASVTGDVVITATAVSAGPSYTNLIDEVGYTDGIRLSTGSDSTKDAPGYVTTGHIRVDSASDVIRTKGCDFRVETNGNCAYAIYDSSKVRTTGGYMNNTQLTSTFDSEGNVTFSVKSSNISGGGSYIRLTGYGTGANLIVTKNEEII